LQRLGTGRIDLSANSTTSANAALVSLLEAVDLTFGYTNDALFTKVGFRLEVGERAALVAPNGAGKSTLLRILAGEVSPDKGTVVLAKDMRLGYYRQSHELKAQGSVFSALMSGFGELVELRAELEAAQERRCRACRAQWTAISRLARIGSNSACRRSPRGSALPPTTWIAR
jgi:ATP-binding cassette subfamily F protein 3